ncbi:transposase [Nitrosophilus labii]|uniref:transposase n=1 Tax=Nitrosophilus labii TaxID=2706014 RepID=UPI0024841B9C|nr:transposase [Nitrosophilus labii]
MARVFIAKSVYNIQTTRDLIERLYRDRTLRVICGWRYKSDIPSESKFSRVFNPDYTIEFVSVMLLLEL